MGDSDRHPAPRRRTGRAAIAAAAWVALLYASITGGALCGKWWRGSWHGTGEGYGMLTLRADRVDWEYHGYGWKAVRP
jgi:hypothetical protein